MARCTLDRQQAMNGSLPRVCMCCGLPATTNQVNKFTYTPFWMLLMNVLPTRFTFYSWTIIEMPTPLCHQHEYRMWLPFKVKMAAIGAFLLGFALTAICAITVVLIPVAFVVLPLAIVSLMVLILAAFYLEVSTPRLVGVSKQTLKFESCSDEFAQQATPNVQGWPAPESDVNNKRIALAVVGGFGGVGTLVMLAFVGCCGLVFVPHLFNTILGNQRPANQQANNQNQRPPGNENPQRPNNNQVANNKPAENPKNGNGQNQPANNGSGLPAGEFEVKNADEAAAGLKSEIAGNQTRAFFWLHRNGPPQGADKAEVAAALNGHSDTKYADVRKAILKGWYTSANADLLLRMFEEARDNPGKRRELHPVVMNLDDLKDERFINVLLSYLTTYELRGPAKKALIAYGKDAEILAGAKANLINGNRDLQNIAADLMKSAEATDEDYVEVAINGLKSDDRNTKHRAVDLLKGINVVESRRFEVSQLLADFTMSGNPSDKNKGVEALQTWIAPESVDQLLPLFESKDVFFLRKIFGMFAESGNPKAAPFIAKHHASIHTRQWAANALKKLGPSAEAAIAPMLLDFSIEKDIRPVIKLIGTSRSAPVIQQAMAKAQRENDKTRFANFQKLLAEVSQREGGGEPIAITDPTPTEEVSAELREWTDSTGAYKIKATFIEVKNGQAQLKRESGETISLPLNKLSEADQIHIREFLASRRK